jgi:di/tricarboxylate transporter
VDIIQTVLFLGIMALTFTLIVSNRVRPDLVALLVPVALGSAHILPPSLALAGFSNSAVITIAGLFVITTALERTGFIHWLADRLATVSGNNERRMRLVFMGSGALLSLVLNNIAAGAVLLPAVVRLARHARITPSRLLIPLAFGTLLGGMATLFTTANIIISGSLQAQGLRGLSMLDFLPIGGLTVLAGFGYMLLVGEKLLPYHESAARAALSRPDLTATYSLSDRLWEVTVLPESPLVQQRLADTVIGNKLGLAVVAIWHGREAKIAPTPSDVIEANDILLVLGREERVRQLEGVHAVIGRDRPSRHTLQALPVYLSEVIIAPRSSAIGETIKSLRLRSKFGVTAVALWREGQSYRTDVGDFELEAGDALLVVGPPRSVRALAAEPGYIVLDAPEPTTPDARRARTALAITVTVLLLSAFGLMPTAEAMLTGAAGLVLARCITMEEAYRAIEWRVVILIAGLLPFGTALVQTGLAHQIGMLFTSAFSVHGPLALIGVLYIMTAAVTQFVGGQVAALVMGPIAISAATQLDVNPQAVGVAVAMACSAAFLTPVAHPVNILMMGPGGYIFKDFLLVGLGMLLVCLATLLIAMPLLWQL